jgi:hypothetical protein
MLKTHSIDNPINYLSIGIILIGIICDQTSSFLNFMVIGLTAETSLLIHMLFSSFGIYGLLIWPWIQSAVLILAIYVVYIIRRRYTTIGLEIITASIVASFMIYITIGNLFVLMSVL